MAGTDFTIAIVADFSGGSASGSLDDRAFVAIDRDDFEGVFATLAPHAPIGADEATSSRIPSFGDLHPERIVALRPDLDALREARRLVGDPERMKARLRDAGFEDGVDVAAGSPVSTSGQPPAAISEGELLDAIVTGAPDAGPVRVAEPASDPELSKIIDRVVGSQAIFSDKASETERREAIDAELSRRLRAIYARPAMRACEARWHALHRLVRRIPTDESLRIRVLDASPEALRQDLADKGSIEGTALHAGLARLGLDGSRPDQQGMLLVADPLPGTSDGLMLCAYLAALAGTTGLSTLVELPGTRASDSGSNALDDELLSWVERLRDVPGASRLGAAFPPVLARAAHGCEGERFDGFDFDENPEGDRAGCVWAGAGWVIAELVGRTFSRTGGTTQAAALASELDLPCFVAKSESGATAVGPLVETLPDTIFEAAFATGLTPLLGAAGVGDVRIAGVQSLTGEALFGG